MTNKDAEYQLFSLMKDAQSHFTDDGDDEVFREDEEALMRAIIAIQRLTPRKPEISSSGVYGVCPNCRRLVLQFEQSHGKIEILHCKWCGQALDWGGSDKT